MEKQNDYEQAIQKYEKVILLKNTDITIFKSLGNRYQCLAKKGSCYKDKELFKTAIKCYQKYLAKETKDADAYVDIGFCFTKLGQENYDQAKEMYQKALEIVPNHRRAISNLQWLEEKGKSNTKSLSF